MRDIMFRLPRLRPSYLFSAIAASSLFVGLVIGHEIGYNRKNDGLEYQLEYIERRLDSAESAMSSLYRDLGQLEDETKNAKEKSAQLEARWVSVTPIDSYKFSKDPLYFDTAAGASLTKPFCTGSMRPTIDCDDLVVAYKPAANDINVGDIIIYKTPSPDCQGYTDGYTMHRVVSVISRTSGPFFQTKGDANSYTDSCLVPPDAVTGKVLAIIHESNIGR